MEFYICNYCYCSYNCRNKILYRDAIEENETIRFIGRIISSEDAGDTIRKRRTDTQKPYNITNGQKYYKSLVDKNNINLLLIGPDESGTNYDTMLIASIDDENNVVKFINLPRDIYVDYSDEMKTSLKSLAILQLIKGYFQN